MSHPSIHNKSAITQSMTASIFTTEASNEREEDQEKQNQHDDDIYSIPNLSDPDTDSEVSQALYY